jgi:arylsulfatase A-like enzyme
LSPSNRADLPHIILIVMDSVGAKRCSAYGHHRDTTPGLRRLAAEGVLYKHCFAPGAWTLPSHISLFSGLYPGQHGGQSLDLVYPGNYYLLPEILREMGYRTLGLSSNYLISRDCNFQHGFDEFYEMDTLFNSERYYRMRKRVKSLKKTIKGDLEEINLILKLSWQEHYPAYPVQHLLDRVYRKLRGDLINKSCYATERSFGLAKKLLKKYRNRPLFLFFNFMEAHARYNPPEKFRRRLTGAQEDSPDELLYEQEIAFLDERLLDFYQFLERQGLKDKTLFIVTADHGEGFGEHGIWGHIFCLYNELIHIPLIVKYPANRGQRGESAQLVQLHDLFATIMEIIQAPFPVPESSRSLLGPGRDLALAENLDTSFGRARDKQPAGFQNPENLRPCRCIIDRELHKLIEWPEGRLELFDLKKDYQEKDNLAADPASQTWGGYLKGKLEELLGPFTPAPEEPLASAPLRK